MEGCLSEVQKSPSPQAAHASKLPSLLDSPCKLPRQTSGSHSRGGSSNRSSTKGKTYELCNSPTPQQLAALRSTSTSPTPRKAFHSRHGSRNGSRNGSRKFLQQGEASSSRSFHGQSKDADKGDANINSLLAAVESALLDRPSFSDRESGNSGDNTCSESGRIDLEIARENILSEPSECTSQRPSFLSSRLTGRCSDEFQKNKLRGSFGERASSFGNRSGLQSFGMRSGSFQRDSLGQRGNSFQERAGSFQRDSLGERRSGCHDRGDPFQISLAESLGSGKVADWSDPDCKDDVDNLGHIRCICAAQRSGAPLREFRRLPCLPGPEPSMGQIMVASARSLLAQRRSLRRATFGKDQSRYMSAPAGLESAEAAARSSKSDVNQPSCHDKRPASACKASFQSPTTVSDAHSPKRDDTAPLPVRAAAVVAAAVASAVTRTPMATLTASTTVTSLSSQKAPDEKLRIRHDKHPVTMESHAVAGEPSRTPQVPETPAPKWPTSRPGRTWVCDKQYTQCGKRDPQASAGEHRVLSGETLTCQLVTCRRDEMFSMLA